MTLELLAKEMNTELGNESVQRALLATTFKGLKIETMKQAIMEGMMRGFKFKNFLEKDVYAVPFGTSGYSLVTSIDYARKLGMKGNVVGVSEPKYEMADGKIISCTVTVKKKVGSHIGDFTATVFFDEYTTGRNLWATKPRTMIAKVAEMHALRKACPEELAKAYTEEEITKESVTGIEAPVLDVSEYKAKLESAGTIEEMKKIWSAFPGEVKTALESLKNELKRKLSKPAEPQDIRNLEAKDINFNEPPFPNETKPEEAKATAK